MKLRSNSTKILIILSVLSSFAFQGDSEYIDFYINSHGVYYPNSSNISVDFSGESKTKFVMLRAYKINNPLEYFKKQDNPHSPKFSDPTPPNLFSMIKSGFNKFKKDLRYSATNVINFSSREILRDLTDYNGTELKELPIPKIVNKKNTVKNNTKVNKQIKNTKELVNVANNTLNSKKLVIPSILETMPLPPREAEDYPIVKEWNYTLKATKDSWRNELIPVPLNEKGVYIIEVHSKGVTKRTVLVISEYVAVLKQHGKDVMVFVVNQQSGEKVSDFPLTFLNEKIEIGNGKTNSSGVLKMKLNAYDSTSQDNYFVYDTRIVLGTKDDNFVICDQMTYNYENESKSNGLIFLQTERPVYRPSHTVFYRGVIRNKDDNGQYIKPKKGDSVFIEINDSKDAIVKKDTLITNEFGSFSNNFVLGDEASTGTYSIKANCNQLDGWQNFTVDEYKKPEYKVEVIPEKKKYTKGDTVIANVKANYFFGSPVTAATVTYYIYRSSIQQPWWVGSDWEYLYSGNDDNYSDYRSTLVTSNTGSLNPDGTFKIVFPTQVNSDMGFTYRIKASVEDASRRSIEASTSVTVTFSEFYLSSRTDKYFYGKSDFIKATINAKMYDENKPLSTSITSTLKKISWKKVIQVDKTLPVKYERIDTKLWEGKVTSNDKGQAEVNIPPTNEKGYFLAEFISKDKNGSAVYSNEYIYVGEQDYSKDEEENNYGSVKIIPDKPAYNKGETISALIIGPAPKVDALISIEGQTLYSYSVERFNENSSIIHFEAEEKLLPEFTLSVSIVVNGTMYTGEKELKIIPDEKLIKLEIKTDKVKYLPGENADISVRTLNSKGEPCPNAEVALGLVDEAIYSIEPDITPNIQRFFFGPRYNQVSTSHSYNFSFSDAFRNVNPTPGFFGFADNGSINRKLYLGDVKGNLLVQPAVRKDFRDMAYWKPDLKTDNNGFAKINIKMPDNLTKWRISARAIDANSAVGQQFSSALVRKELLIRMEMPRFVISGDEVTIAVNVHNYLLTDKQVKLQFNGENIVNDQKDTVIKVIADGEQRFDWRVKTLKTGSLKLTTKALTNEESDAIELTVPVLARGVRVSNGYNIELNNIENTKSMNINIPNNVNDPEMFICTTPSLAGGLVGSLNSLIGYPYGCVEQTMSRFLPTIIVASSFDKLKLSFDLRRREEIPKMIQKGFNRFYQLQHKDGGWGWWENDETHPFMTAYVMYGMAMAKRLGYKVEEEKYDLGVSALSNLLDGKMGITSLGLSTSNTTKKQKTIDATTLAYAAYSASIVNYNVKMNEQTLKLCNLLLKSDTLNNYAKALLALAFKNLNDKVNANKILQSLITGATKENGFTYWKGKNFYYNWQDDDIETSAMAVRALLEIQGANEYSNSAIRWLLTQRGEYGWHNTRQTAMVCYALADYLSNSGEVNPDYTLKISVNGSNVFSKKYTTSDIYKSEDRIKVDNKLLKSGNNNITIEKSGNGKVYSNSLISYFSTESNIPSAGAGFTVSRDYYILKKQKVVNPKTKLESIVYLKTLYNDVVKSGDEVFVKVKMTTSKDYDYVMVEEPIPAGCEIIRDENGYNIQDEINYQPNGNSNNWYWKWWYSSKDIRDEKIAFFANSVNGGTREFSYILRAQIPGTYNILPSQASLMYFTEVRGNSKSGIMKILP